MKHKKIYYGPKGSVELLSDVLKYGVELQDPRTKTKTKAVFGSTVVFKNGEFPFYSDQASSPRLAFEEMWFFLRGDRDTQKLEDKGCNFWVGNTTREFLDSVGLFNLPEKNIGAAYSSQFRNFGGYSATPMGVDQLKRFDDGLSNQKYGRRHLITLWNPLEEKQMPLTPCWWNVNAVVLPDENGIDYLHFKLSNRSLDTLFGFRYAAMNYRLFQIALCKKHGFELGELECSLSHIHVYENQYERAKELVERTWDDSPNTISLNKDITTLDDLLNLEWSDWHCEYTFNKEPFKTKRPIMVA